MSPTSGNVVFRTSNILVIFCSIVVYLVAYGESLTSSSSVAANVTNPLIYTRLRHDPESLQVVRRYQLKETHKEKKINLKVNDTFDGGRERTISYYVNNKVEASSITEDDLILDAMHLTYKTRILPSYVHIYDKPADRKRASDPKKVSPGRCKHELEYLNHKLDLLEAMPNGSASMSPETLALFDSNAVSEPGVLMGNMYWVGLFRQCERRHVVEINPRDPSDFLSFRGRYCIASIKGKAWGPKIQARVKEMQEGHYFHFNSKLKYDFARFFRIQVGVCLPDSCNSESYDNHKDLIKRLTMHKLGSPFKDYEFTDLFCLPDETSELRQYDASALAFIWCIAIWCSIVLLVSLYDWRYPAKQSGKEGAWSKFISTMSLKRNYDRLVEIPNDNQSYLSGPYQSAATQGSAATTTVTNGKKSKSGAKQKQVKIQTPSDRNKLCSKDLFFLNFLKVYSMFAIIFGHVAMLLKHTERFPRDFDSLGGELMFHFNGSAVFNVDWFFTITGFLMSYLSFINGKVERNKPMDWLYSVVRRYWRLAPMYVMVFWWAKSVFKYVDRGPLWDYGTSNMTVRGICQRESWIYPLTLTSNFHPIPEECIMPSWYICNDMQFYLVTPFLLILLSKSPLWGWITIGSMMGVGNLARFRFYMTNERVQSLELMRPRYDLYMFNNWDLPDTYLHPWYRMNSYLVGLLAGHYTYMVISGRWQSMLYYNPSPGYGSTSGINSKRFKNLCRFVVFSIGAGVVGAMSLASYIITFYPREWEPHIKFATAVVYSMSHTNTSLGLAMVCVTMMFGQFKLLRYWMSHPLWTLLSRVGFFVYLAQVEIIYWILGSDERIADMNWAIEYKFWCQLIFVCYAGAVFVTLFFEYPLAQLERQFIGGAVDEYIVKKTSGNNNSIDSVTSSSNSSPKSKRRQQNCELATLANNELGHQQQQPPDSASLLQGNN